MEKAILVFHPLKENPHLQYNCLLNGCPYNLNKAFLSCLHSLHLIREKPKETGQIYIFCIVGRKVYGRGGNIIQKRANALDSEFLEQLCHLALKGIQVSTADCLPPYEEIL